MATWVCTLANYCQPHEARKDQNQYKTESNLHSKPIALNLGRLLAFASEQSSRLATESKRASLHFRGCARSLPDTRELPPGCLGLSPSLCTEHVHKFHGSTRPCCFLCSLYVAIARLARSCKDAFSRSKGTNHSHQGTSQPNICRSTLRQSTHT